MSDLRRNGKPRHIGDGTLRRRQREALRQAAVMMIYKDTPNAYPAGTRQQQRAAARSLQKVLDTSRKKNDRFAARKARTQRRYDKKAILMTRREKRVISRLSKLTETI